MSDKYDFTFDMACSHCSGNMDQLEKVRSKMAVLEWDISAKSDEIASLTRQLQECREAKSRPVRKVKEAV